MSILITGGLGYIGSNTCKILLEKGFSVVIIDNLSNSKIDVLDKLKKISKNVKFYVDDIRENISHIFKENVIDLVIHFAGLKSVNMSIREPLEYYDNNVVGTINLLFHMKQNNVKKIIFSSSCTVYGEQKYPVDENAETGKNITNPYGKSKYIIEQILNDFYVSDNNWCMYILRYFNPVGADSEGLFGEDPNDIPNNLFPYILGTASGKYEKLFIFGGDYDTNDGTCVRDFIHVQDLAEGHIACINKMEKGLHVYNLGTGKPTSVLEFVNCFERVTGVCVEHEIVGRRDGDLEYVYANADKAYRELGWKCERNLQDVCIDGWKYVNNYENKL